MLPPDAVDLIVEDNHAAEEAMSHERRKGEPAVRNAGLQKVYRRGFIAEDEETGQWEEGEVEVEGGAQGPVFDIGDADDVDEVIETEDRVVEEVTDSHIAPSGTPAVTQSATPPLHTYLALHDIPADDNPWA